MNGILKFRLQRCYKNIRHNASNKTMKTEQIITKEQKHK